MNTRNNLEKNCRKKSWLQLLSLGVRLNGRHRTGPAGGYVTVQALCIGKSHEEHLRTCEWRMATSAYSQNTADLRRRGGSVSDAAFWQSRSEWLWLRYVAAKPSDYNQYSIPSRIQNCWKGDSRGNCGLATK